MALSEKLNLNPDKVPNIKLGLHVAQVILAITIFILEIIVFRADKAKINGNNAWPFGLAAYNTANSCGSACAVSKAVVGIAFFETLAWALSTLISAYTLRYYQQNGDLPGYEKIGNNQNIDPDKAAFSMAPHDEEAYAPINMDDHHHDDVHDDHHDRPYDPDSFGSRPIYEAETSYQPHHTSSPAPHENPFDNSYRPHSASPNPDPFANPYAVSGGPKIYAPPTDDYDDGRPVQFPSGNYDRTLH
ncbi:hypothetical protein EKO27_g1564 [Xylaria grammica]|uniref:MARVEL domain-containing protein n=1 Tax=Xylaria grammica TaxID=363999 RepID=A0A439DGM9_9PEZI|nr:hypothetical protein EKO27_g1564 [Xylaria grammica]